MSSTSQPAICPRRRLWPYVVATALAAGAVSAWYCHHLWTTPVPPEVDDQSSAMGEMIVLFLMSVGVIVCTLIGALLGWMIGCLVRAQRSLPREPRN